MKKNRIDIIVNAEGKIVATSSVGNSSEGNGCLIRPAAGHKKHTVELSVHIINNNPAEFHNIISNLLYFENDVAKIRDFKKK